MTKSINAYPDSHVEIEDLWSFIMGLASAVHNGRISQDKGASYIHSTLYGQLDQLKKTSIFIRLALTVQE